jgi:hypothetical protein
VGEESLVTVYRFRREEPGNHASPRHMWGTLEAIAMLDECTPILDSAREVHATLLDNGFYYEHSPTTYRQIDSEGDPASGASRQAPRPD